MGINNFYSQSGAGSTPDITPGARSFLIAGDETGVLIIHGYGGSIGDYRSFANQLHARGYTVSGVRLAGHGQGLAALQRTSVEDWRQSVADGMAELRRQCRTVFILGSSFGAVLALDYAVRHPDHVPGLALVNCALSYRGGGVFQGLALRLMRLVTPYYPKRGMTEAERQRGRDVGSTDAWPIDGILATSLFARRTVGPSLPRITAPALIMYSARDPVVGQRNSDRLIRRLGSQIKMNVPLPVATHRPFRDSATVEFLVNRVDDFFGQVIASRRAV